jgi:hypothetical protein
VEVDEAVHGFGAAVVRAVDVEVGQEHGVPLVQGSASLTIGHGTGVEAHEDGERIFSPSTGSRWW